MKLSCPGCNTSFSVPDQALQPAGRTVRCGRCGHVWFAGPDGAATPAPAPAPAAASRPSAAPAPAPVAPPAAPAAAALAPTETSTPPPAVAPVAMPTPQPLPATPPQLPSLVTTPPPASEGAATIAEAEKPGPAVHHPMRAILGWATFVLVAAALAGAIYFHEVLAAEYPATRPLYRLTRLMSAPPLEGLRFTTTSDPDLSRFQGRDLPPVVTVRVAIVNESWRPRSIRTLRGMTIGDDGRVLTSWEPALSRHWLWPGERTVFASDVSLAGLRPSEIQFKLEPIE